MRFNAVMKHLCLHLLILLFALPMLHGCQKFPENPNRPILPYPITIYPNKMEYQDLHTIGGWVYITAPVESTSRGIIVFHSPNSDNLNNEFIAYDRMPPNYPDACTDSEGNSTRLVVDGGWVIDRCNNAYYNILNGQIIINDEFDMMPNFPIDSVVVYPLIQYQTTFDGNMLTISN